MANAANRWGDRLLGVFLGSSEAGACVPEMGEVCACITDTSRRTGTGYCRSDHKWIYFQFTYKVNCFGPCTNKTSLVCGEAYSGLSC